MPVAITGFHAALLVPIANDRMRHPLRTVGAAATLLVTLIAAGVAIWQFVS